MTTEAHLGLRGIVTSSIESGSPAIKGLGLERGPEGRVAKAGNGSHCMTMGEVSQLAKEHKGGEGGQRWKRWRRGFLVWVHGSLGSENGGNEWTSQSLLRSETWSKAREKLLLLAWAGDPFHIIRWALPAFFARDRDRHDDIQMAGPLE